MSLPRGNVNYLSELLLRFSVMILIFGLLRFAFLIANTNAFVELRFADFIAGCWFDVITIGLFFLPYALVQLISLKIQFLSRLNDFYFHFTALLLYLINTIDIEYFGYTSKRITFDFFNTISTGKDFQQMFLTYLLDFWLLVVLFASVIFLHFKLLSFGRSFLPQHSFLSLRRSVLQFLIAFPLIFLIARGGIFRKPISIVDLVRYTRAENTSLIANSGFTLIKSFARAELSPVRYFSDKQAKTLFDPHQESQPQHLLPEKTNVVFIVLESFGIEFIGQYSNESSYTPFLDSLIEESLWFEYAYANGVKSNEAIPAIVSSLPSLMNNPYISSAFINNKEKGLAKILAERGYSTAFYHGATNGSMNFDSYAKKTGFQSYFGRKEYGNDKHFDHYWGISDEYFNPWTAKQISKLKTPFFATLFTISSHHPYYIPDHLQNQVKKGPQKICASINYGDYSLRKFFDEAKKQPWFKNTLFVLCADHTPSTTTRLYKHRTMQYRIPILFYHPGGKLIKGKKTTTFQQLDIMPTVLDLLDIKTKFYGFGQSYFSSKPRQSFAFLQDNYYYFFDQWMLTFDGKNAKGNRISTFKSTLPNDYEIDKIKLTSQVNRLKAIIQQYNNDMLNNQITTK